MKLTIKQCDFLLELLKSYRNNLYMEMRKQKYQMEDILQFISGYELMCDWMIFDLEPTKKKMLDSKFTFTPSIYDYDIVLFENEEDVVKYVSGMVRLATIYNNKPKWSVMGIRYALCLAKYYTEFVLTGKDTELPDGLYMELPDKDNPDEYDWEAHGIKFDT